MFKRLYKLQLKCVWNYVNIEKLIVNVIQIIILKSMEQTSITPSHSTYPLTMEFKPYHAI